MGRPYAAELRELDVTYNWSLRAPIDELARSVGRLVQFHALMIGSGGSLTAAHVASFLHARFTGRIAQTLTPYELASLDRTLDDSAVLICSAGGSNPDVIAAAQIAAKRAPAELIAVTTRPRSKLEAELTATGWAACHSFATPTKKDGFLATNSLVATIILLIRSYERVIAATPSLPETLDELLHPGATRDQFVDQLREEAGPLLARSTVIALHGATTKPAVMDMESRFTEAALAAIQPADYRNFAHGRHHWLACHAATTGVIAFSDIGDEIARRTLAILPKSIPRWQVSVEAGPRGGLTAVCYSILLALVAGQVRRMDPGRPRVPAFGRKLYHLRAMPLPFGGAAPSLERMNFAIERKARLPLSTVTARGQLDYWQANYRAFVERLAAARIRAIVIDYDGTLCAPGRRFTGPSPDIMKRLQAILDAGVTVAVATGRGKSVREALRKVVRSAARRSGLIVGYHNGAEIGTLSDDSCPPTEQALAPELTSVATALCASPLVARHATMEAKGQQIAIELLPGGAAGVVLAEVSRLVRLHATCGKAAVITSSHSIDVIAGGVSKSNVVSQLVAQLGLADGGATSVLCLGDRGRPPGNDAELLTHPLSLSVDEPSDDPSTCWTLAEPGRRFDLACLEYLTRLRPTKQGLRFDVKGVRQ